MRLRRQTLVMMMAAASVTHAETPVFPQVKASNLNKKVLQLPADLQGHPRLVLVAFERQQQQDVDTWLAVMPALQKEHPGLAYYELPTISRLNGMVRWFIDNGMRGGIPDPAQRERTITLYLDKAPFEKALAIGSEKQIHALLLDRDHKVIWRAEGRYSAEKGTALAAALARLKS